MSRQTTIQDTSAIRKGSVRVLIGDDAGSLTDIGALRNPVITSMSEQQEVEFDNVRSMKKFVKGDKYQVTFDLAEINLTNLAVLDAGMVNITTVAAALVSGAEQLIVSGAWNVDTFIKLTGQNGDGSAPTINSVTGATDGAMAEGTDYYLMQDGDGDWGIMIDASATAAQNVTVNSDYTPNASKRLTFNECGESVLKYMRIVNENENGEVFQIDIQDGTNFAPISIDFAGDEEDDVAVLPVDFQGYVVDWVDEQQTA